MYYDIFIFIISYDIWFYVSHIILHKYLYNIHNIHHSVNSNNMTYLDTYVGHYFENIFQGIGILFPLFFIQFCIYSFYSFIISFIIINIRGMLRHDHRVIWLIGEHHILHHKYPKYNFGEFWLDYLFSTCY